MDIRDLRCFLAVAERLNFSRAAESLYMSQPALSLRINSLEESLGVTLFSRTHQKVYLTPAGSALLPEVQELLARFDGLPQAARSGERFAQNESGLINVALDASLPDTIVAVLAKEFAKFYEAYPGVHVEINSIDYDLFQSALISREYDICFMGFHNGPLQQLSARFSTIAIAQEDMVLAYVGSKEESAEELFRSRILLLLKDDRWNDIILNYLNMNGIGTQIRMLNDGLSLGINIMHKDTIAYMPFSFFQSLSIPGLHYLTPNIPDAQVISCLVWDRSNHNPALQLLINCFDDIER